MRVGIITRNENRSPKVLALSLQAQLEEAGITSEIIYSTDFLLRLQPVRFSVSGLRRLLQRIKHYRDDMLLLKQLRSFDVLVLSECIPNAFWRNWFAIEELKRRVKRPVVLYEVYYLGNAPTQMLQLQKAADCLEERFDWHFSVSPVTEIRVPEQKPWSCIGLNLVHTGLAPVAKKEFTAVVDFPHTGYEACRALQLKVLAELGIKTICLDGNYSISEIREIYKEATVYFMQSTESFGLPIAECFASGAVVFAASSSWPMSWRLDESPEIHGEGTLGEELFYVYENEQDLREKLQQLLMEYDLAQTPARVFGQFLKIYPQYYYGRPSVLKKALANLSAG